MNNQSLFAKVRSVLILLVSLLAVSTVWADDPSQETITYIDRDGEKTLTEEFIVLAAASSSSVSSSSGAASSSSSMPEWYVVKGEVFYDCSDFNFAGQRVNLLLMDGAKLTVKNGGNEGCAEFDNLVIYAQSVGDNKGEFEVASLVVGNLNVVGGAISVSGAVEADNIEFTNGSVSVGGGIEAKYVRFINGTVVVAEGVSAVSDADTVSPCIQFAGATVRANSYSVSNRCEAKVGNNLLYGDELGNAYNGTLSAEQLASIAGKKVAPAKWLTFDYGESRSKKAWIPGVIPSEQPTRIWKKFLRWYTDKSYENPFDFTNFESGATAYAKWENLVNVTYIDGNGQEQTLTEDYTVLVAASSSSVASSSGAASSSSRISSSSGVAPSSSSISSSGSVSSSSNTTEWYVVSGEVSYNCSDFDFAGKDVNLVLMDGAKLTIQCNSNESSAEFGNLNVYAQSLGENMGQFEVSSLKTDVLSVYGGSILIGTSIDADIVISSGLVYGDEQGNAYRSYLSTDQIASMAGKKVAPAKMLTFVDGSSVSEKAWIPGVIPSEPTRIWKKFIGWYTNESYLTPFDFKNFESGATAYAKWEDLVEITYINENGVTQTLTEDYTALVPASSSSGPTSGSSAGVPFTPSDGWYVVSGKVYYNCSDFNFAGKNVNLILMDDAWLTFECNNSEGSAEFGNLTIYAQSLGKKMGGLRLSLKDENKKLSLNVADKFVVNGGKIWADAIETSNAEFNKGSVYAYGEIVIKETDEDIAGIKLAGATVYAYSYSISGKGKIWIEDNLVYVNEQGDKYSSTLNADQITSIAHEELSPAKMVTFDDGNSVSNKAVILGEIPCTPVAEGQKFRWYADESRQELFDFTNFNSGAIAYGLWEKLTEVTYLDENGEEQRVTPGYELVGTECGDSELFTNGGWVLVNSEVSYENGFAFTAENLHLILADDAKLTVKNKTLFNNLAIYAQSTGVNQGVFEVNADSYSAIFVGGALTINGGVVKATGGVNGIEGRSVKINDGVVKAFGKQAIYVYGNSNSLVVNGGTVEAHGTGERPGSGEGLTSNGNVDINGGTVTATGGYAINANGNVDINGGTVTVTGGYAINAYGNVDINGGTVTATGGYAINAYGDVTIAGGKVNATSSIYNIEGDNYVCFGIGSYSDVYLKGGTVTALAKNGCRGIYADHFTQKAIYLSGATVKASSYNDSIVVADDMSYYDDLGNSFTGIIHEDGLSELANKYVYPYAPALVITKNDKDKMVATLDGNFGKDMPVVITQETTVEEVEFNRGFTAGKYATVMFPFDVYADNLIGAKLIDAFDRIDTLRNETTKMIEGLKALTSKVWDKPAKAPTITCDNLVEDCEASVLLKANTPYMVQLEEGHTDLKINGAVKLVTNASEFAVRSGDWEFVGVYQYKKWAEDDAELQKGRAVYGFVGTASDGFEVGDFVRGMAGATIKPMRAYLRYNPLPKMQSAPGLTKVARYNVADWNSASVTIELPETITVVRGGDEENGGEHTTVIADFNTRSGKFALPRSANRVFDLKGRAYGKDARKARGAYYGKKVLK